MKLINQLVFGHHLLLQAVDLLILQSNILAGLLLIFFLLTVVVGLLGLGHNGD